MMAGLSAPPGRSAAIDRPHESRPAAPARPRDDEALPDKPVLDLDPPRNPLSLGSIEIRAAGGVDDLHPIVNRFSSAAGLAD